MLLQIMTVQWWRLKSGMEWQMKRPVSFAKPDSIAVGETEPISVSAFLPTCHWKAIVLMRVRAELCLLSVTSLKANSVWHSRSIYASSVSVYFGKHNCEMGSFLLNILIMKITCHILRIITSGFGLYSALQEQHTKKLFYGKHSLHLSDPLTLHLSPLVLFFLLKWQFYYQ